MKITIDTSPKRERKRMETSKKLAWFSAVCFAIALLFSMVIYAYGVREDKSVDWAFLVTLIGVTGAAFGTTMGFYFNMNKAKNLYLIKRGFLKIKYLILDKIGKLSDERKDEEIENELSKIEADFEMEEDKVEEDIEYKSLI